MGESDSLTSKWGLLISYYIILIYVSSVPLFILPGSHFFCLFLSHHGHHDDPLCGKGSDKHCEQSDI